MDKRTKILMVEFNPATEDGREWDEDLRLAISVNPDIDKIKNAMDENGKQMSIEFLKFALEKMGGHSVDAAGNVEIKYNGEWITAEKLFENFL
jgi:hypothetical protein